MKLSIIMISYNEKKFIANAIESCLRQQTDFPIEIIIGDDGSTDGSIEIIKEYCDKYPKIIKYFIMDRSDAVEVIPSIRVSNIIKKAFSIAEGDYFNILSGDDFFVDNNKLKVQVDFLEKNKEYASCYTNFKKIWNNGNEIECKARVNLGRAQIWSSRYMHISCFVFRKDVTSNILENFCDDTGLIYSIFITGKTMKINNISFAYRQRDNSIMSSSDLLELYILELLILDDVEKKSFYKKSSMSRFSIPLRYVYDHRNELKLEKYNKYINFASKNSESILLKLKNYDDLKKLEKCYIKKYIYKSSILRLFFAIYCKIETAILYFLKK